MTSISTSSIPRKYTAGEIEDSRQRMNQVIESVKTRIIGHDKAVFLSAASFITPDGHVLFNGKPGQQKTRLVKAFGQAMGRHTNRIQFTPDLMPIDITGYPRDIINKDGTHGVEFMYGPINCDFLHADEINRTQSRTLSALLQAMGEGSLTVEGQVLDLAKGFLTVATQNPGESKGTYEMPDATYDRFRIQLDMHEVDAQASKSILKSMTQGGIGEPPLEAFLHQAREGSRHVDLEGVPSWDRDQHELLALREMVRQNTVVPEEIYDFIVRIEQNLRPYDQDNFTPDPSQYKTLREVFKDGGSGQRGSASVVEMARATSFLKGKDVVEASDVMEVVQPCYIHRLSRKYGVDDTAANTAIKNIAEFVM